MKYSLIIDIGTSSMRGVVFDEIHLISYVSQKKYFMVFSGNQSAEQDSGVYRKCLEEILKDCSDFTYNHGGMIIRIGLTAQRSSVLAVNRAGEPLAPVMMWYDKRSQAICEALNYQYGNEIYDVTGMYARPMFSASKMRWLKENRPDIYDAAYKLVGIQDYLIFHLTGEWVTDRSFASRTNLMDLERGEWSERMLDVFGIDRNKLCRLIAPGEKVGRLNERYVRPGMSCYAEVYSSGGDQQCSALGQGLFNKEMIGITNGTASYVVICGKHRIYDKNRVIHINFGAIEDSWMAEVSNMGTGSVYDWVRHLLYENEDTEQSIEAMNDALVKTQIGAGGIIAFPYLAGKGMPDWHTGKAGCLLNLRLSSKREDIARAFMEGLAFEIGQCYERLEEISGRPEMIQVSGGVSGSPMFNQMLADILNRKLTVVSCRETTAVGAYMVMMLSCGGISEQDMESLLIKDESADYWPDKGNARIYSLLGQKRKMIEAQMPFTLIADREYI